MDAANAHRFALHAIVGPVVAAVALHTALLSVYVTRHGNDPAALVCVGEHRVGQPPYERFTSGFGADGYDGQFYYAIARNPWKRHDAGVDAPAARHLRIFYPAVCWLFSHGLPRLLIWVMPAVNLLAIGCLAGLGAALALRHGMSAWWGFTLPLAVSAGLPALRDLTDPVSTCALCGLLVAWLLGWRGWAVILWAAAAVFSREQNVGIALLFAGLGCWQGRYRAAFGIGAVAASWLLWVGFLRAVYGAWPFLDGANFDVPLAGLIARWEQTFRIFEQGSGRFGNAWSTINLTVDLALAFLLVMDRKAGGAVSLLVIAGVVLAALAGPAIYAEYWSYTRVLVWLPLGVWLGGVQSRQILPLLILTPQMLWSLLVVTRA